MQIVIYFIFVIIVTIYYHKKIVRFVDVLYRSFLISSISTLIYQLSAYIVLGYIDKFIIIAVIVQFSTTLLLTFIIYLVVFLKRKGHRSGEFGNG